MDIAHCVIIKVFTPHNQILQCSIRGVQPGAMHGTNSENRIFIKLHTFSENKLIKNKQLPSSQTLQEIEDFRVDSSVHTTVTRGRLWYENPGR